MRYSFDVNNEKYIVIIKRNRNPVFNYNEYDLDKYILVKKSNKFRIITKEDVINHKYSGVCLFPKEFHKQEDIETWIEYLYNTIKVFPNYLNKPFPPIEVINKIKIISSK